jgi:hypothetical protein
VHDRLVFLHRWFFLKHDITWKRGFSNPVAKSERDLYEPLPDTPSHISSFIDYPELYFSPLPLQSVGSSRAHISLRQFETPEALPADASWWQHLASKLRYWLRPRCLWPGFTVAMVTLVGPNSIVYFHFFTPFGQVLLIKTYLPLEPLVQVVEDAWYSEACVPRWLVWFVVNEARNAFIDDVKIWDRKSYADKPLLVRNDGPIPKVCYDCFVAFYCCV